MTRIEELSRELEQVRAELSQSRENNQQLEQELSQTKETLQTKQEQLKKSRLEVVGLQAKLKKMPTEPVKPVSSQTEPINPWVLGVIMVVGVGLYLLLKRRKEQWL